MATLVLLYGIRKNWKMRTNHFETTLRIAALRIMHCCTVTNAYSSLTLLTSAVDKRQKTAGPRCLTSALSGDKYEMITLCLLCIKRSWRNFLISAFLSCIFYPNTPRYPHLIIPFLQVVVTLTEHSHCSSNVTSNQTFVQFSSGLL